MIAIDPGPERSALVDYRNGTICQHVLLPNSHLLSWLDAAFYCDTELLVIEQVRVYGLQPPSVIAQLFETCTWSGRFAQRWLDCGGRVEWLPRLEVKRQLCGTPRANDAGVRQALIERFGGSKDTAIGTKSRPGPLYGVKRDVWAALAVAVAWCEREAENAKR